MEPEWYEVGAYEDGWTVFRCWGSNTGRIARYEVVCTANDEQVARRIVAALHATDHLDIVALERGVEVVVR